MFCVTLAQQLDASIESSMTKDGSAIETDSSSDLALHVLRTKMAKAAGHCWKRKTVPQIFLQNPFIVFSLDLLFAAEESLLLKNSTSLVFSVVPTLHFG